MAQSLLRIRASTKGRNLASVQDKRVIYSRSRLGQKMQEGMLAKDLSELHGMKGYFLSIPY